MSSESSSLPYQSKRTTYQTTPVVTLEMMSQRYHSRIFPPKYKSLEECKYNVPRPIKGKYKERQREIIHNECNIKPEHLCTMVIKYIVINANDVIDLKKWSSFTPKKKVMQRFGCVIVVRPEDPVRSRPIVRANPFSRIFLNRERSLQARPNDHLSNRLSFVFS